MKRPTGSNADEWVLFLQYWLNDMPRRIHDNIPFLAVQIAEAIESRPNVTIAPATLEGLQELLRRQDPNSYANTHGALNLDGLTAMLLEDAAMVISRPGSWEGSRMADLLQSHGYDT